MKITVLGSGTSQGIPVIGCDCEVCHSSDPRDSRLRCSVLVGVNGQNILIDTSPDLRQQMLSNNVKHVDAVLYTHEHNDHVVGLDDIRPFNFMSKKNMPIHGPRRVLDDVRSRFSYAFYNSYPGAPRAEIHYLEEQEEIQLAGEKVRPINVMHGNLPIYGYRIGDFVYLTDVSEISGSEKEKLRGAEVIILSALRKEPHYSHFTLNQAVALLMDVKPERAYITHISHNMGFTSDWEKELPGFIKPVYDGLVIDI